MSIIRDWRVETKHRNKFLNFFNINLWLDLHERRRQRADRGWSDVDAWAAGDYIARITAEMLQHLQAKSLTHWPDWFDLNIDKVGRNNYQDLQEVIDDINNYLDHNKTSWTDNLEYIDGWHDEDGKELTEDQVSKRIKKWQSENFKLYKKAQKAMQFFGRNFTQFWD